MKFIITESQYSKTKQMVLDSFKKFGYIKTIQRYKLSPPALDRLFPDGISEISDGNGRCTAIDDFIFSFFRIGFIGKSLLFEYGDNMYKFYFTHDRHTAALIADITDIEKKDTITVYASPFYEGDCFVPVDVVHYEGEEGGYEPSEIIQYQKDVNPDDIKSFSDIIDWFNNEYPAIVLELLEEDNLWYEFRV
jgi:ribosomal protein S8